MKRVFFALIALSNINAIFGQAYFKVTNGTNIRALNGGQIIFNGVNIINDGYIQSSVNARFTGSSNDTISGTGISNFNKLHLFKAPTTILTLKTNLNINSEVFFSGGLLNLDQYNMNISSGLLINESENSRAYTTGNGLIIAFGTLNAPSSVNLGNLGAVISSSKNLGATWIYRGHKVQQNIYGSNSSIQRYYDIQPANNISLKATLRLYYFNAELNGIMESTLIQWKKKNPTAWDYVGADSKNPTANYVERNNISKFTVWTLAPDTVVTVTRVLTSTSEKEISNAKFTVNVMPNPTSYSFSVSVQSEYENEKIILRVIDVSGKLVDLKGELMKGKVYIIGENYMPGVYFIEVIQGTNRKVIKLIKQ
jgi:hypothetical protein